MTTTLTNPANHETAADRSTHVSLTRPRLPRWVKGAAEPARRP